MLLTLQTLGGHARVCACVFVCLPVRVYRCWHWPSINTLRPRQNGRHFADDICKCIFVNENVWIPIIMSLKFVPKEPINNIPALVQIMAWRRPGDKPLSEPMMVNLPTHICVTRPEWVNAAASISIYMFSQSALAVVYKTYTQIPTEISLGFPVASDCRSCARLDVAENQCMAFFICVLT